VKFVVDAQLPPALVRLLREAGCDAFAVREIGPREASDAEIWRYAVQQQSAIITKDEDFAERCLYSRDQPVIVWLRILATHRIRHLLSWFVALRQSRRWKKKLGLKLEPVVEGDGRGELNIRSDLHSIESDRAHLKPSNLLTKKVCL
jgi:predicted nuclease of predicted toxin-antitoxin system